MNLPFRILSLQGNPDDVLRVGDLLERDGITASVTSVVWPSEFSAALKDGTWDLIISDYRLPEFTGLQALRIVRGKSPTLPFILTADAADEASVIECLKAGATDYILKQNPLRLPSAVRRAIDEAAEHVKRQEAEDDLRRREQQYRLLFQGNPNPMWVFDLERLEILEVNESAVHHYGYTRDEFLRMTLSDLRVPESGQRNQGTGDAQAPGLVWKHRRKDGVVMDMEVVWSPLAFAGRLAALTMAVDVTVRRRIAQNNRIFAKLSHQLSEVTTAGESARFICEAADELFRWDDFALEFFSVESDTVMLLLNFTTIEGRKVELPAVPRPEATSALVRRAVLDGKALLEPTDPTDKPGMTMAAPIRQTDQIIGVILIQNRLPGIYSQRDLDTLQNLANQCGGALQRVRAEEELLQSQRRFRDLFENSPDAIFVEDLAGKILDVNLGACRLHGLSRAQLVGKNAIDDLVPAASQEVARNNFQRLSSGEISWVESESVGADGQVIPVEIRVVRVDYEGRPALLFHIRDITMRRAAEMALRSSETLFRSVWENSVDGMRLMNRDGFIVAVNKAYCELVGLSPEFLEGQMFTVAYAPEMDFDRLMQTHRERFSKGVVEVKRERELRLHDGRKVMYEITDTLVASRGQATLLLSLFRDITGRKQLEEQLRQSQKMEAIGQLTGGIAHDFNNILTIILGHATLLTLAPLDAKSQVSAQQVKQAAERAAGLTRQLLAFGRKQIFSPRPLDLNRVISRMSDMVGRLLGEDIALQLNFSDESAIIKADVSMVEQIILNLSVNSRDAMPRGGRLAISTRVTDLDVQQARQFMDAVPGRYVCLSHQDSGCGISPENIGRIFEPFFTTKELGKGTGLGLATVFGIVKQHHGWIQLESEPGLGSTFHVYLPASEAMPAEPEKNDTQFRTRGGSEVILVVEDEHDLRDIVVRTLTRQGYRVFQAGDGQSALEVWQQHREEIDLLFTDVIMPGGINGRELAEKLCAEKPSLKVIYSSGYAADALGKDFQLKSEVNYLQKPYLPQVLARIVRRCLDTKEA